MKIKGFFLLRVSGLLVLLTTPVLPDPTDNTFSFPDRCPESQICLSNLSTHLPVGDGGAVQVGQGGHGAVVREREGVQLGAD